MEVNKSNNNKKIIGIILLVLAVVCCVSGYILSQKDSTTLSTKNKDQGLNEILDNMKNLNSYKVVVNKESAKNKSKEKVLENIIQNNNEKNTNSFGTKYVSDGKILTSGKYNNEEIWYYLSDSTFSSSAKVYKTIYNSLFSELKNYKFEKSNNIFKIQKSNSNSTTEEKSELKSIHNILYTLTGNSYSAIQITEKGEQYNITDALNDVQITVKDNNISSMVFKFIAGCQDNNKKTVNCPYEELYTLTIDFSDLNKAKVELAKDVLDSLKKTTAGDWVGTYEGKITCSDGKSYDGKLELEGDYSVGVKSVGWKLNGNIYDCTEKKTLNLSLTDKYQMNGDKIVIYDLFDKKIAEYKYSKGKITIYDASNKLVATLIKK